MPEAAAEPGEERWDPGTSASERPQWLDEDERHVFGLVIATLNRPSASSDDFLCACFEASRCCLLMAARNARWNNRRGWEELSRALERLSYEAQWNVVSCDMSAAAVEALRRENEQLRDRLGEPRRDPF